MKLCAARRTAAFGAAVLAALAAVSGMAAEPAAAQIKLVKAVSMGPVGQAPTAVADALGQDIVSALFGAIVASNTPATAAPPARVQGDQVAITVALLTGSSLQATYVKSKDGKQAWVLFPPQKVSPSPGTLWEVPLARWVVAPAQLMTSMAKATGTPAPPAAAAAAASAAKAKSTATTFRLRTPAEAAATARAEAARRHRNRHPSIVPLGVVALVLLAGASAPLVVAFVPERWLDYAAGGRVMTSTR